MERVMKLNIIRRGKSNTTVTSRKVAKIYAVP